MVGVTQKPINRFSDHFMRVFGLRPDQQRLVSDRGYATNVLLTAQRCNDAHLKQAALEVSTMLADQGKVAPGTIRMGSTPKSIGSAAHDGATITLGQPIRRSAPAKPAPPSDELIEAIEMVQDTIARYLTPFKAHSLLYRLQRVNDVKAVDQLLGDLQAELMRSVNTETALQIMNRLRTAVTAQKAGELENNGIQAA